MVSLVAADYAARKHSEHDGQVSVVAHKANLSGPAITLSSGNTLGENGRPDEPRLAANRRTSDANELANIDFGPRFVRMRVDGQT